MRNIIIIIATFLIYSCNDVKNKAEVKVKLETEIIKTPSYCNNIENTIGILFVNNENFNKNDDLIILNKDLSTFKIWRAKEEYEILSFKCFGEKNNFYSILIDNEIKFIKKTIT